MKFIDEIKPLFTLKFWKDLNDLYLFTARIWVNKEELLFIKNKAKELNISENSLCNGLFRDGLNLYIKQEEKKIK